MHNNKAPAGEKFKTTVSLLLVLAVIGGIVSLAVVKKVTILHVLSMVGIWYLLYIPVAFADVLASIEENTDPRNYIKLLKSMQSAPEAKMQQPPVQGQQAPDEKQEIADEPVSCPKCFAVQSGKHTRCWQCGANIRN